MQWWHLFDFDHNYELDMLLQSVSNVLPAVCHLLC